MMHATLFCIVLVLVTFCMHYLLMLDIGTFIVALWTSGSLSTQEFKHSCSALVLHTAIYSAIIYVA